MTWVTVRPGVERWVLNGDEVDPFACFQCQTRHPLSEECPVPQISDEEKNRVLSLLKKQKENKSNA